MTKLLNMVGPDVAYFGQKDAQQALVIRRLVRDLDLPVRDRGRARPSASPTAWRCRAATPASTPTSASARSRSARALRAAEAAVAARRARRRARPRRRRAAPCAALGVEPEYLALVDPDDLRPVAALDGTTLLLAVAARVGTARLIDNDRSSTANGGT